jgi:hypothetical protein
LIGAAAEEEESRCRDWSQAFEIISCGFWMLIFVGRLLLAEDVEKKVFVTI